MSLTITFLKLLHQFCGKYLARSYLEPDWLSYKTQANSCCLNAAQMKHLETCSIAWIAHTRPRN